MEDNQIETMVNLNENSSEPVPVATTDAPGIASFSSDDFVVDSNGKVEALTKYGIAHMLTYVGDDNVGYKYTINLSLGKQFPKVGDIGLVLTDEIVDTVDIVGCQIGNVVRLTAIQTDGVVPVVYYGKVIGSILGPRGKVGPRGEQGIRGPVGETGEQGEHGEQGEKGDTGNGISSVYTLSHHTEGDETITTLEVAYTESPSEQVEIHAMNGEIGPQGIQGPVGPAGPAGVANVTSKGAWKMDTVYYRNDLVYWPGDDTTKAGSYICAAVSTMSSPVSEPDDWGFFVAEGAPGPAGPVGPTGENGAPGAIHFILSNFANDAYMGDFKSNVLYKAPGIDYDTFIESIDAPFANGPFIALVASVEDLSDYGIENTYNVGDIVKIYLYKYASGQIVLTESIYKLANIASIIEQVKIVTQGTTTATQGTFTSEQLNTLKSNQNAIIVRENERYILMDNQHESGYLIYSHIGHNSTNNYNVKCITVTVSTGAWILSEQKLASADTVVISSPSTAVSGTLTDEEFSVLSNSDTARIFFANEYYVLMDKNITAGYSVYTHHGEDSSKREYSKFLYLIHNTHNWSLQIHASGKYLHELVVEVNKTDSWGELESTIYMSCITGYAGSYSGGNLPAAYYNMYPQGVTLLGSGYYIMLTDFSPVFYSNGVKFRLSGFRIVDGESSNFTAFNVTYNVINDNWHEV